MHRLIQSLKIIVMTAALTVMSAASAQAFNQTADLSPVQFNSGLPFRVRIEIDQDCNGNQFLLPNGLQAYVLGIDQGKWLLLNGRTNGLHGFAKSPDNFPPETQNTVVYVVDPL